LVIRDSSLCCELVGPDPARERLAPITNHHSPITHLTVSATPAYDELCRAHTRIHRYSHLAAIVGWDRNAMMPPKGNEARAAAEGELAALIHRARTDPGLVGWLRAAEGEPLDDEARANLREIRRDWRDANALPESLVEAKTLAGARCEHAWRAQRAANDWNGFVENFREVVRLAREEAQLLADDTGLSRYDALMDRYEPGMRAADIDRIFGDVRQWLPDLVARAQAGQRDGAVIAPAGPFPVAAQRALNLAVMRLLRFDFEAGRLDESMHPFSGGVPEDVRLTTRYRADDFAQSLMGTIHETGHARFEQNLPRAWLGQPIGVARSYGIHESQSLSFEMQLARGRPFVGLLSPLLAAHFGAQPAFEPDNLHRMLTRVRPGLIRVNADEVTYPAHIILRYEIERPLVEGGIEIEDIPALWDEKMQSLLGLDTRGNYRDGCLQDVHWSEGAFGYFPSYTLGAMYAAQWFAALRRAAPDLDARIAAGDFSAVFDWLAANIWSQASRWETPELVRRASGEALNPAHFRAHLEARYLGSRQLPA
jgi:carboxypeptidase Taq